jgi:hypothetical protein
MTHHTTSEAIPDKRISKMIFSYQNKSQQFSLVPAGIGGVLQFTAAIIVYIIRGQAMN